ncbi:MAG: CocE/NonD family hydrolase [Acidobacteria bacterium]|nr:CocE/NonD family hydrolase [Acidobacteriota bacterium]
MVLTAVVLLATVPEGRAWPEERPAQYKFTCNEVQVPMRDGTKLAADLYLPEGPGPWPVIVERTPYNKNNCKFSQAPYFAERGYAVLIQDVRGRYRSPDDFYWYRDEGWGKRQDGYDTIEWAGTQSWSNGRVGTMGLSYTCFNQNLTAVTQPPHLKAMFCSDSASNWYKDNAYTGGVLGHSTISWFLSQDEAAKPFADYNSGRGAAEGWQQWHVNRIEKGLGFWASWQSQNLADIMNHTTYDDYWRQFAPDEHVDRITVPAYYLSGWYDRYPHSVTTMFQGIRERGGSALARQSVKLIIGPWIHGGGVVMESKIGDHDFGPEVRIGYSAFRVRWFDYHLRGIDNGIMKEAPVRIFVMGSNQWREEKEWPIARAVETKFYLRSARSGSIDSLTDGSLSRQAPSAGEKPAVFEYSPMKLVPSIGADLHMDPMGYQDHRPVDRLSVTFTSEPLAEDLEISGPGVVELHVSSTADDTDFVAILTDVHPEGYSQILRRNIIRASRRDSLENPTPIEPGKVYKLAISMFPMSNTFLKGHRLRLSVSSNSFPKWLPGHNKFSANNEEAPFATAINTVYLDAQRPSTLTVPVIPAK